MAKHTIALIFDFDDTLVPDSTTALLRSRGVDADDFWKNKVKIDIENGWDPVHAYLKLLLDLTLPGQPLQGLTNKDLRDFGATLKPYSGAQSFFRDIKNTVTSEYSERDVDVEFWIISGGLEEIIKGCTKISRFLKGFWGCRLASDTPNGPVKYIKRAVSFTEKTRYIFEINKGLMQADTNKNPLLVNKNIEESERRVPFDRMIYVGDGLTDIPCFSLIRKTKGAVFAILHRDKHGAAKRDIFENLVLHDRATSYHSPRYGKDSDLRLMLKTAVVSKCTNILLEEKQALT